MNKLKVVSIKDGAIIFEEGVSLYSDHRQVCCENHYLDFSNLSTKDFEGLEFDLTNDKFFNRIPDFGIELIPVHGFPVRIAGYASNNGYYSSDLSLILEQKGKTLQVHDITDCQEWNY